MGLTSVLLPLTLGEATGTALIPLLLAATPLPVGSAVPFREPTVIQQELPQGFGEQVQVETFDPVARAAVIAQELPRQWSGTYQSFGTAPPQTVQLTLGSAIALGQMVDVRGEITVGGTTVPVQGNINAKSDQLDLLLLGDVGQAGIENGGEFRGLQGFSLSGWRAPRFTNPGGQLTLTAVEPAEPAAAPAARNRGPAIRGLW